MTEFLKCLCWCTSAVEACEWQRHQKSRKTFALLQTENKYMTIIDNRSCLEVLMEKTTSASEKPKNKVQLIVK